MADQNRWCFAWLAQVSEKPRAALLREAKWMRGETITVSFLDGDPGLQQQVKQAARLWTAPGLANLHLAFQKETDTNIRISFRYKGSWSAIGTTCKQVPASQPTMNYGWLTPSSSQQEIEEVVLHEFGHATGFDSRAPAPRGRHPVEPCKSVCGSLLPPE